MTKEETVDLIYKNIIEARRVEFRKYSAKMVEIFAQELEKNIGQHDPEEIVYLVMKKEEAVL